MAKSSSSEHGHNLQKKTKETFCKLTKSYMLTQYNETLQEDSIVVFQRRELRKGTGDKKFFLNKSPNKTI